MVANESVVHYHRDFESVNLLLELMMLVLIIFAGIGMRYKRRRLRSSVRDE